MKYSYTLCGTSTIRLNLYNNLIVVGECLKKTKKRSREAPFYILIAEMGLISAFTCTLWAATNFQSLFGRH